MNGTFETKVEIASYFKLMRRTWNYVFWSHEYDDDDNAEIKWKYESQKWGKIKCW